MASDLHVLLRRRRLHVFVDLKAMTRFVKQRWPLAVARRRAEYVIIDRERVPLGYDEHRFVDAHLARIVDVRNGLGYTRPQGLGVHHAPPILPSHLPAEHHLPVRHGHGRSAQDGPTEVHA